MSEEKASLARVLCQPQKTRDSVLRCSVSGSLGWVGFSGERFLDTRTQSLILFPPPPGRAASAVSRGAKEHSVVKCDEKSPVEQIKVLFLQPSMHHVFQSLGAEIEFCGSAEWE